MGVKRVKYHALKKGVSAERTAVGLVGRRQLKKVRRLADLRAENYKTLREKELIARWFPAVPEKQKKKIVVITAHDDDLITFSGVFAKFAKENDAEIHHLILTDGSMGCGEAALREFASEQELKKLTAALMKPRDAAKDPGYFVLGDARALEEYADLLRRAGKRTAEIRQAEAREAERILGWHATYFLDYQDAALGQYDFGVIDYRKLPGVTAIALRLVRDIAPDLMVLQDRNQVVDFHPDHYASGRIGYTIYWHLHCPVLGVDAMDKPFKAIIQRGFEGIARTDFRLPDYIVELNDAFLRQKLESLYAYKNQLELVNDLFRVEEMEKFRLEGFFDIELPPARIDS